MALYTPPSLPRTPSSYAMSTLPSLPSELLTTWSMWRQPKEFTLLTPPMTSSLHQRRAAPHMVVPTLPTIAQLDLLPSMAPPTPPSSTSMYTSRQPIIHDRHDASTPPFTDLKQSLPNDAPYAVDWLDFTRTRSARFIAEKTCEMICYLWFSRTSPTSSPYPSSQDTSAFTALQFVASPTFVSFMQKVLETTQVSESVIVLSLYYIHRLKEVSHWFTSGQQGSEFRIAVAALMMANKFLDDNTYTNKTWSEVSGIELEEINRMEREFLTGIDFELCVRKEKYELWLNLLKGMVMAKERDWQRWQRTRLPRTSRLPHSHPNGSVPRTRSSRIASTYHRARSTSPTGNGSSPYPHYSFVFTGPPSSQQYSQPLTQSPTPRPGSKRTAEDAFSPTSATFALPSKRPPLMSLEIPVARSGPPSSDGQSPLEPLKSFSKMSLGSSPLPGGHTTPAWLSTKEDTAPQALVAAYRVDEQRSASVPQNLYFYSLTCSPTENDDECRYRKGRLRYHQPPLPTTSSYLSTQPSMPLNIQSATSSPHDRHMNVGHPSLPHFHDAFWQPPPPQAPLPQHQQQPQQNHLNHHHHAFSPSVPTTSFGLHPPAIHLSVPNQTGSPVPSAPFANAGPPGVQLYSTSMPRNNVPYYPHQHQPNNWHRGRQYY